MASGVMMLDVLAYGVPLMYVVVWFLVHIYIVCTMPKVVLSLFVLVPSIEETTCSSLVCGCSFTLTRSKFWSHPAIISFLSCFGLENHNCQQRQPLLLGSFQHNGSRQSYWCGKGRQTHRGPWWVMVLEKHRKPQSKILCFAAHAPDE